MFSTFKRLKKASTRQLARLKRRFSNTYYLSIGENCLTDNVLDRFHLKSFSTPYSHGRSNLDYAIHLEAENYSNLLNSEFLYYDYVGSIKVVRNRRYLNAEPIYNELHLNGFEFTHHDVIANENHRRSLERKVERMKSFDKRKKLKFVYHYRACAGMNLDLLMAKAEKFLSFYTRKDIDCEFIFFTQEIVPLSGDRELLKIADSHRLKGYLLRTLEHWAGNNQDVFWGRKDDDLFAKMFSDIR